MFECVVVLLLCVVRLALAQRADPLLRIEQPGALCAGDNCVLRFGGMLRIDVVRLTDALDETRLEQWLYLTIFRVRWL